MQLSSPKGLLLMGRRKRASELLLSMMRTSDGAVWGFDETSGSTLVNLLGDPALNGTNVGATIMQSAKDGYAYSFDGVDDYVRVTNNAKLANRTTQRWAFLVKPLSIGELGWGMLQCWGQSGTEYETFSGMNQLATQTLQVSLCNTVLSVIRTSTTTQIDLAKFQWVFWDYDNTETRKVRIFIGCNGSVSEAAYSAQPALTGTYKTSIKDLYIGNSHLASYTFDGLFDLVGTDGQLWTLPEMQALVKASGV